jgi:hypothetical protein
MRLLDEEAGVPAEDVGSEQILDRIQDLRMPDHFVDPWEQHVAAMAHLALDRSAGLCLVIFQLAAKFADLVLAQRIDREMIAALAIVRDFILAQHFRHGLPPMFLFLFDRQSFGQDLWCDAVAPDTASGFLAFDFRKQPHRKDHEKSEERNNVLDALVSENVLVIGGDGGHQYDNQRQSEFDFDGHRRNLR